MHFRIYVPKVFACEFACGALTIVAVELVGAVPAVVLMVALPALEDAPTVPTPVL